MTGEICFDVVTRNESATKVLVANKKCYIKCVFLYRLSWQFIDSVRIDSCVFGFVYNQ